MKDYSVFRACRYCGDTVIRCGYTLLYRSNGGSGIRCDFCGDNCWPEDKMVVVSHPKNPDKTE